MFFSIQLQHYLTVGSPYDTPSGEGWYHRELTCLILVDEGTTHDFAFQSPLVVTPDTKQYLWTSTSGLSTLQIDSITMSTSGSVTGNYGTQYYFTVTSTYDSPTPTSGWFDDGTSITASVTSTWPGPAGVRYVCTGWTSLWNNDLEHALLSNQEPLESLLV